MNTFWSRLVTKNTQPQPVVRPRRSARFEPVAPAPVESPAEDAPNPTAERSATRRQPESRRPAPPANNAAPTPDSPPDAAPPLPRVIHFNTITPTREVTRPAAAPDRPPDQPVSPVRPPKPTATIWSQQEPVSEPPVRPRPEQTRQNTVSPPGDVTAKQTAPDNTAPPPPPQPSEPTPVRPNPALGPRLIEVSTREIEPKTEPPLRHETEPSPTISVKIGRIEVRATSAAPQPSPAPPPPPRFQPSLSLENYLKRRNGGEQ